MSQAPAEQLPDALRGTLNRVTRLAGLVGIAGLVVSVIGAFVDHRGFFRAYLFANCFWIGMPLGCIGLLLVHHLAGGSWAFAIRRPMEASAMTIPLFFFLFLPLCLGLGDLYEWAAPDAFEHEPNLVFKAWYLQTGFVLLRGFAYFATWTASAVMLRRWSIRQDALPDDAAPTRRLRIFAGPAMVLLFLTITFFSIDWMMSLEPHWPSTIYGVMVLIGYGLAAMAAMIITAYLLSGREPLKSIANVSRFHDLGNLTLAFTMLWAYMAYDQFFIIWSGNMPEETSWYLHRLRGGWQYVGSFLMLFHFFVPFFLLLYRDNKRNARNLSLIGVWIILVHAVDLYWLIRPAFSPEHFSIGWIDPFAFVGVGGIWLAAFAWLLTLQPLVPLHDPLLIEIEAERLAHEREHESEGEHAAQHA